MSPEQLEGMEIDSRSDIFSLGVVLYELATGDRPFRGDSSVSLISSIIKDTPLTVDTLREELPHHLGRVIAHCLEKNPKRRYQSAIDVHNELDALRKELESGIVPTSSAEGKMTMPPGRRRWWLFAAGAAVVLVAVIALWLGRERVPSVPVIEVSADPPMIVVLPFENLGSSEDEFFADGMTEEITSRLAAISGLGIISRTSAMQYKRERPALKQIGEELGVDYVLEGTVRWEKPTGGPSRVRVTPQLVRVSDDVHLWSERYDRTLEEIFAVQSAIAEEVIERVGVELLTGERTAIGAHPTENLEAYEAYLRGVNRLLDPEWSETSFRMAAQMFDRGVRLDPGFALAHARFSLASAVLYWEKWDGSEERLAMAKQAAERALELAPDLPQAHLAMGCYHYYGQRDYDRALEAFREAHSGLPNDTEILRYISGVLRRQGRFEEATSNLEKAARLDPRAAYIPTDLGFTQTALRQYEEADRSYARSIALVPDQEWTYGLRAISYILWGDLEKARTVLEEMPTTVDSGSVFPLVLLTLCERNYEEALIWLSRAPAEFTVQAENRTKRALWEGLIHRLRNEREKARIAYEEILPNLEKELQDRPEIPHVHANLGWAYAALGRKEEAVREGRLAVELLPISNDAFAGPYYLEILAQIGVMTGDHSLALDQIEVLLSVPADFSVALLEVDPRWDPLRNHPRFQALLEKYGNPAG